MDMTCPHCDMTAICDNEIIKGKCKYCGAGVIFDTRKDRYDRPTSPCPYIDRATPLIVEIEKPDPDDFKLGDYVTRDGTDIHYVEEYDSEWRTLRAVCIIAPSTDWTKPGELEDNMIDRYCRCNRHFLPFAKAQHEKLKKLFPDGWVWEI